MSVEPEYPYPFPQRILLDNHESLQIPRTGKGRYTPSEVTDKHLLAFERMVREIKPDQLLSLAWPVEVRGYRCQRELLNEDVLKRYLERSQRLFGNYKLRPGTKEACTQMAEDGRRLTVVSGTPEIFTPDLKRSLHSKGIWKLLDPVFPAFMLRDVAQIPPHIWDVDEHEGFPMGLMKATITEWFHLSEGVRPIVFEDRWDICKLLEYYGAWVFNPKTEEEVDAQQSHLYNSIPPEVGNYRSDRLRYGVSLPEVVEWWRDQEARAKWDQTKTRVLQASPWPQSSGLGYTANNVQ